MDFNFNQIDQIVKEVLMKTIKNNGIGTGQDAYDKKLAAVMEHSMIRPDATPDMVKQYCQDRQIRLSECFFGTLLCIHGCRAAQGYRRESIHCSLLSHGDRFH